MRLPHEVLVVVRREAEFLMLHRAPQFGGYWHLVAGGVEEGETAAEAAVRELLEEVRLEAQVVELDQLFTYAHEPWEPVEARFEEVTVECFLADAPADWEPVLNEEHDDVRWCSSREAQELLFWPEPRQLVRDLADP